MEHVSISQLKDQLSAYLKRVQAGETVLVTDRNKPVARLEPILEPTTDEARVARLEAARLVTRPKRDFTPELVEPLDFGKDAGLLAALLEEREENR
jgi:prevent-host-death family protein